MQGPAHSEILSVLFEKRDVFRRFLKRHAPTMDADDVLQGAYTRATERQQELASVDDPDAWFYRVLRNAVVDQARRASARSRATEALAHETPEAVETELPARPCKCLHQELEALKPEYQESIRRVDVDGERVIDLAGELGISANNAMVRLHRARKALKKRVEHTCGACAGEGCRDCSCGAKASSV